MWSVADPDLQIRGRGGHPDPEIKGGGRGGGLKKKSFLALRASVWSENKGGGRAPRYLTWIRHWSLPTGG